MVGSSGFRTAPRPAYPGGGSSNLSNLTVVDGKPFFTASDPVNGNELWVSDGTQAGTILLKDIYPSTGGSTPSSFAVVNGQLVFQAYDPTNGYELWVSDGTEAGTVRISDTTPNTNPESSLSYSGGVAVSTKLFFVNSARGLARSSGFRMAPRPAPSSSKTSPRAPVAPFRPT
jgi:ELWxxDGT repeat protein